MTHQHQHDTTGTGWRARIPTFTTGALAAAIAAFMIGGLTVAPLGGPAS